MLVKSHIENKYASIGMEARESIWRLSRARLGLGAKRIKLKNSVRREYHAEKDG
jgi:hypothetical protein